MKIRRANRKNITKLMLHSLISEYEILNGKVETVRKYILGHTL